MQYHEQLKHPLWQKKRLEVMASSGFRCENCGDNDGQLNVHHPFYKRGAMIWQYEEHELMCLCNQCHKDEHAQDEEIKMLVADRNICKKTLIGYLKACNDFPGTILNSHEEIAGYLDAYGIHGKMNNLLTKEIIKFDGRPYDYLESLEIKTAFVDIATICNIDTDQLDSILRKAGVETLRRIASYRKERS